MLSCSKIKQQHLINGFVGNNSAHDISCSIKGIIHAFWCEYIWWTIQGQKLTQCLNANIAYALEGKPFHIGDFHVLPVLYSNGIDTRTGCVGYWLQSMIPPTIRSLLIHYELFCFETKAHEKATKYFPDPNTNEQNNTSLLVLEMSSDQMKHSELKKHTKQLNFMYHIDILQIRYKDIEDWDEINNYYKEIAINKISMYKWNIYQPTIESFNNANKCQAFYSPSFGCRNNYKCWTLCCIPKGIVVENKDVEQYKFQDCMVIRLKLLAIPFRIKKMEVKVNFWFENTDHALEFEEFYEIIHINRIHSDYVGLNTAILLNDLISKLQDSSVWICCRVEITNIWIDSSMKKISGAEMYNFGLLP